MNSIPIVEQCSDYLFLSPYQSTTWSLGRSQEQPFVPLQSSKRPRCNNKINQRLPLLISRQSREKPRILPVMIWKGRRLAGLIRFGQQLNFSVSLLYKIIDLPQINDLWSGKYFSLVVPPSNSLVSFVDHEGLLGWYCALHSTFWWSIINC